ncbi:MAG: hypothetical protein QOF15_1842 [Mycobacterium sp.]|jgi:hypothetical protein|nr:hypothetical protein [Mycobacterium sp.]
MVEISSFQRLQFRQVARHAVGVLDTLLIT